MTNHLYYGDNLSVLRDQIADESVDLIYLDPPFNSNAGYNVLFRGPKGNESPAQIEAFDDTWQWSDMVSGRALNEVKQSPYQEAAAMLDAMVGFLGKNAMTAYLCMMGVRLTELHRVLKPTGSLYLHCDPTASHYLKILLDAVFGARMFRNEIVWQRTSAKGDARTKLAWNHDVVLCFGKAAKAKFRPIFAEKDEEYNSRFRLDDEDGRGKYRLAPLDSPNPRPNLTYEYNGFTPPAKGWRVSLKVMEELDREGRLAFPKSKDGRIARKHYLDEQEGRKLADVWTDIPPLQSGQRLGYPTEKPPLLLERIIAASSNEGDVVLDPFCGCGTTVHAAQKLNRKWIGIDVTHIAVSLIETRLFDAFGPAAKFTVHGTPKDVGGAQDFFDRDDRTKKEFEKWAVALIKAYPQGGGKKGADGGIDGLFWFGQDKDHKAVVSVKGGRNVGVGMVRDLDAVVTEQKAAIGVLLTLTPPTKPMVDWANKAGTFDVDGFGTVPRLQIVTIEEALARKEAAVETRIRHSDAFKAAPKEKRDTGQAALDL